MWVFLSRRLRRWALLAVAVPVGGWVVEQLRDRSAASRGETSKVTRALDQTSRTLDRYGGGRRRRR